LKKAEDAVDSIRPQDIVELKATRNPSDTTRVIFDTVNILFQQPLDPVSIKEFYITKQNCPFVQDSFDSYTSKNLQGPLLKELQEFSKNERDNINEETIELLEPYLTLKAPDGKEIFVPQVAQIASKALGGLCTWAAAMSDYHIQSKIVKPKLRLLSIKTQELEEAQEALEVARGELRQVEALKAALRKQYDDSLAEKNALQESAAKTKKKMDQANRLINSLGDNKVRWIANANEFKQTKINLVGNVAKACAFISYCGPFNSEFRSRLTNEYFQVDLQQRGIPNTEDLDLTRFLVD